LTTSTCATPTELRGKTPKRSSEASGAGLRYKACHWLKKAATV